jgi:hypothetical protein
MPTEFKSPDLARWREDVLRITGSFLVPQEIKTLLVIQPASSGDIALATTVIARVKAENPQCRVTIIARKATASLIPLCPDVDAVELISPEVYALSRKKVLEHFAGRADRVVHIWCFGEPWEMGMTYNLLETMYLLAGWPTPPERPASLKMRPTRNDRTIEEILEPLLKPAALLKNNLNWKVKAFQRLLQHIKNAVKARRIKGSLVYTASLQFWAALTRFGPIFSGVPAPGTARYVILSMDCISLVPPPRHLAPLIVAKLKEAGWTVLQNLVGRDEMIPGVIPLYCSYDDFLQLREHGIPMIGWRSGLCDLAAAAESAPLVVLFPREAFLCGFAEMGIRGKILEVTYFSDESLDWPRLLDHIAG